MIRARALAYLPAAKTAQVINTLAALAIFASPLTFGNEPAARLDDSPIVLPMDSSLATFTTEMDVVPADTGSLIRDVKAVLTRKYPGVDTVALIARIQERMQWGEKDDRFIEAEGILHWDRGETHLALPCFRRLNDPGPLAMSLMAEGLLKKGERYEAAAWFLKAARAYRTGDPATIGLYRSYLDIKTGQGKVELELAAALEMQNRYAEALDIYSRHQSEIAADSAASLRLGSILSSQGRENDAIALYQAALAGRPADKTLWVRLAQSREALNQKVEAAQAWMSAWKADRADLSARNRAIAHYEVAGADSLLKILLLQALEQDSLSAALHFKLAVTFLRVDDKASAYAHLDRALKLSPGNPTYLTRISDAIESDSLIKIHFAVLRKQSESDGATPRLLLQVARGYSLAGEKAKACRSWSQAHQLSGQALDGRRDAFQDLAACGDAASQKLALSLGGKLSATGDREFLGAMTQIALRNKSFDQAAAWSIKLIAAFPEVAPAALATVKTLLAANDEQDAQGILSALTAQTQNPEASFLLGKIHFAHKDYARAAGQFALASAVYPEAGKLRGACLLELKDLPGAAAEYGNHYARTGDKESLRTQADLLRQLGSAPQERQSLETLYAKSWAKEADKLRLGLLAAAQGDTSKAAELFAELFRVRASVPQDSLWSQAALILGNRMASEGKSDKAIKFLTMGLKSAPAPVPNRAEVWLQIGDCHSERGQWKDAYSAYSQGLAADPRSRDLARGLLGAAKKSEDKRELETAYRAIYLLDPEDADANAFLGQASQAAKDYKAAAAHFRRLSELQPDNAKNWESYGNALAMIPDLPAAAVPLQTAIDLGAESDEVYINRARAFRIEGSKDMAGSILEFLLARNPQDYLAMLWSAKFAEEEGDEPSAMELFKKASRLSPPRSPWPELASLGLLDIKLSEHE